jgi:hypothetical protein
MYFYSLNELITASSASFDNPIQEDTILRSFSDTNTVNICHGENTNYWLRDHPCDKPSFGTVAHLIRVCWFAFNTVRRTRDEQEIMCLP